MAYHHRTTITPTAWATAAAETQWVYQCASDDSNPANGPEKSSQTAFASLVALPDSSVLHLIFGAVDRRLRQENFGQLQHEQGDLWARRSRLRPQITLFML